MLMLSKRCSVYWRTMKPCVPPQVITVGLECAPILQLLELLLCKEKNM